MSWRASECLLVIGARRLISTPRTALSVRRIKVLEDAAHAQCSLLGGLLGGGVDGLLGSGGLLFTNSHLSVLASDSLILSDGVLGSSGVTLGLELLLADLIGLDLVNGLDEDVLVLELVTLGGKVELMVGVFVDLLVVSVLLEKTSDDTLAAHPQDLLGHTGVAGTLPSSRTLVTALSLGLSPSLSTGAGVHADLTSHEETVLVKFANVLAYKARRL